MLDWLKNINKDYPDFWKHYLSKFDKKPDRFVILRTHSSGPKPSRDVIFSFGAVAVVNDQIIIGDSFEVILYQYKYLHDNGLSNTFIIESKLPKMHEQQAVEELVNYLGNSILVGHRIHLDVELINEALEKLNAGRLKNEALDLEIMHRKSKDSDRPFTIEELLAAYKIPKTDNSTISDEAYNMALIFLKLKLKLGFK